MNEICAFAQTKHIKNKNEDIIFFIYVILKCALVIFHHHRMRLLTALKRYFAVNIKGDNRFFAGPVVIHRSFRSQYY